MNGPLMPKATAVWLLENTVLTFEQIADFCDLHPLEIKAIADGESGIGIMGMDPVAHGQLSAEDIAICSQDPKKRLTLLKPAGGKEQRQKSRYTPISKRQDRPDAISWLLKSYPELSDTQIIRLIGTTKNTIESIKNRTHWNIQNVRPQNPVLLNICSQKELDAAIDKAKARKEPREKIVSSKPKKNTVKKVASKKTKVIPKKEPKPKKEPVAARS
jgi:hypothetical protein